MSEIVVLQFGERANAVGSHFWNLQFEHLEWSKKNTSIVQLHSKCFLNETVTGAYFPRCVLCDNTGGFGVLNPQTGTVSPTTIETSSQKSSSFEDWDGSSNVKYIQQEKENPSILQKHWSSPYQFSFSTHSFFEMAPNHYRINPIQSFPSFHSVFQSTSVYENYTEKIRYQLEHCDSISGILLLEDISLGWDGVSVVKDYLEEEGVGCIYTVGVGDSHHNPSYNETLCTFNGTQHSTLFSFSDASPCLTACCIDTVLSPCRQLQTSLRLNQFVNKFSLGESRCLLGLSYGTMLLPTPFQDEREGVVDPIPEMNWNPLSSSLVHYKLSNPPEDNQTSHMIVWICTLSHL